MTDLSQYSFEQTDEPISKWRYQKIAERDRGHRNIVLTGAEDPPEFAYYVGLDLGWTTDYTALCIVERKLEEVGPTFSQINLKTNWSGGKPYKVLYDFQRVRCISWVRHLDRVTGRKPSLLANDIVDRLLALPMPSEKSNAIFVAVDATTDWAFVEMLEAASKGRNDTAGLKEIQVESVAIRPNNETFHLNEETGRWQIPRSDLLLRGGRHPLEGDEVMYVDGKPIKVPKRKRSRIRWYKDIPYREVLEEEALSFVPVVNLNTDYTRFEPRRREGHNHDDLVFAWCMAVLFNEKDAPDVLDITTHKDLDKMLPWDPVDDAPPPEPGDRSPLTGQPLPPLP